MQRFIELEIEASGFENNQEVGEFSTTLFSDWTIYGCNKSNTVDLFINHVGRVQSEENNQTVNSHNVFVDLQDVFRAI